MADRFASVAVAPGMSGVRIHSSMGWSWRADDVPDMLQVLQDAGVGDAGELPVQGGIQQLHIVQHQVRINQQPVEGVRRGQPAGINGGPDALFL